MRITAIAVAGLVASTLVTASAAQAEVTAQPALSHFYPLQPTPSPQPDARSEVQELARQVSDLHDSWDSLTPEQRNQRIAQLQQQVTTVDSSGKLSCLHLNNRAFSFSAPRRAGSNRAFTR